MIIASAEPEKIPQRQGVAGLANIINQIDNILSDFQVKAEMEKTLQWLVPLSTNTIKAHQGFGWVGEWANSGHEFALSPDENMPILSSPPFSTPATSTNKNSKLGPSLNNQGL
ncbi:hypothetical protein EZV62_003911 [Acer yangbiense]|uniref:Uncharacterized protein n=1 Tax=Acer yangbiense TaxID=1000413 RepID=A0A5C7IKJ5_9ROSI|nr:hypothetical protein EZV62_003911 [Acer yangbiense]